MSDMILSDGSGKPSGRQTNPGTRPPRSDFHGILPVYKEAGVTSHDVVASLRRILRMRKIGHAGTLDPSVTGVLPVCLGRGTVLSSFLSDRGKSYLCSCILGVTTDTEDLSGRILTLAPQERLSGLTGEKVKKALEGFLGVYAQVPPMYSAKKVDGKRLYELAREGKEVPRDPCPVEIREIRLLSLSIPGENSLPEDMTLPADDFSLPPGSRRKKEEFLPDTVSLTGRRLPVLVFEVDCGKGTYIRSLCRDLGEALQTGGAMYALERTSSAGFSLQGTLTLPEAAGCMESGEIQSYIRPIESVFLDLPSCTVPEDLEKKVRNGNSFSSELPDGRYRIKLPDGTFAALYDIQNHKARICKYFLT